MILEIFIKGFVGLIFLLTLKMGLKRRKVENHWSKDSNEVIDIGSSRVWLHVEQVVPRNVKSYYKLLNEKC